MEKQEFEYDYLILGSGFGGSVSALRLAEKGWRVAVAEQGRRIGKGEISQGKTKLSKLMWMPKLGMKGYFTQHNFRHVAVIGGVGVGGGSIVWAAVMLPPKEAFYQAPQLKNLGLDFKTELAPHLETAHKMLGVATNPKQSEQDHFLRATAAVLGADDTFAAVPNAVYFGEPGKPTEDPYFDGLGPKREGCTFCAGCTTGCPHNAKNALYLNYLYLAEQKGVNVLEEHKAERIKPLPSGGYAVSFINPINGKPVKTVKARNVVLSAGVVGTLDLLFKNRDKYKTLEDLSPTLGKVVRTNSEAITAVLHPKGVDLSKGTTISSDFYPDNQTHITQNRIDRGNRFMRFYMGPMVDGEIPWIRAIKTLGAILCSPKLMLQNFFTKEWEKRATIFTIMQDLDNHIEFRYKRPWWGFSKRLMSHANPKNKAPSYLPVANKVSREYAKIVGGKPLNIMFESIGGLSTTAHILSGCPMSHNASEGVISTNHEVHGYPGLFVVDGASIPANIGVNPSLTITAMAERFAALQPENERQQLQFSNVAKGSSSKTEFSSVV